MLDWVGTGVPWIEIFAWKASFGLNMRMGGSRASGHFISRSMARLELWLPSPFLSRSLFARLLKMECQRTIEVCALWTYAWLGRPHAKDATGVAMGR